jgi:transposase InsO family protein
MPSFYRPLVVRISGQHAFSRHGKPTDNAFIEAFNGRLRQECLNQHWFLSLPDARSKIEAWRHAYNESPAPRCIGMGDAERIRPSLLASGRDNAFKEPGKLSR